MPRVIRRQADNLQPLASNYARNRTLRERAAKEEDRFKKQLMEILLAQGEVDDHGHREITLPEPVPLGTKTMVGIQRQRRAPQVLNPERAEEYLRSKKLYEQCTVTQVVLDEDAILALNFMGTISDVELKALYDENESFAFYPIYEEQS